MFILILFLSGTVVWLLANVVLKRLFLTWQLYATGAAVIAALIIGYFIPPFYPITKRILGIWALLVLVDIVLLFFFKGKPAVIRTLPDTLSNGDNNKVSIFLKNNYPFRVYIEVIDELPIQFQSRNFLIKTTLAAQQTKQLHYLLRPVQRGAYPFNNVLIYTSSVLQLVQRQFIIPQKKTIPVYPSFQHLRKYQLLAKNTYAQENGSTKMRKIGNSMEFEQIRDYIIGDDIRNINWKATARKNSLMLNTYADERSQQVYCLIDKGRLMKMPFEALTLLDYAINATLMMCSVSLYRADKFGLLSFSNTIGDFVAANKKRSQQQKILETLYHQQTQFLDSNFELLYTCIRKQIKQRSLLVLFTNFESQGGLQRQLPYLQQIAKHHLLLVVFFENTELKKMATESITNLETLYTITIAEKFAYEKRLIVKELQQNGILCLLTTPQNVTVAVLNKYLELKTRQAI
jgi:uncharacterized protein (DUF58 family)